MDALFYSWHADILSKVMANLTGQWGQTIQSAGAPGQIAAQLSAGAHVPAAGV